MPKFNHPSSTPDKVVHGQNTDIDASAEPLTATVTPCVSGITVKAMPTNTAKIYVGASGVTTATGYPLSAGESVFVPVDDVSKVYAIGGAANQAAAWIGA